MVRKVGGFTFQELNLTIDDIAETSQAGADLSYDFINRPAYQHALAIADTEFLRLTLNASLEFGVQPRSLVHALQNHDELTYELVHFATRHKDDEYSYRGGVIDGGTLAETIRAEMIEPLTAPAAPYNAIFTTNGIASTTASIIAASLGVTDLDDIDEAADRRHQEGPPAADEVQRLAAGRRRLLRLGPVRHAPARARGHPPPAGDRRHALDPPCGVRPDGPRREPRVPRHAAGTQPLRHAARPARGSRLVRVRAAEILEIRESSGVATATQVDVPPVSHKGMLVMVHQFEGRPGTT